MYKEKYGKDDRRYFAMFNAYDHMIKSRKNTKLSDLEAAQMRCEYIRVRSTMYKGKPLSKKNRAGIIRTWSSE